MNDDLIQATDLLRCILIVSAAASLLGFIWHLCWNRPGRAMDNFCWAVAFAIVAKGLAMVTFG